MHTTKAVRDECSNRSNVENAIQVSGMEKFSANKLCRMRTQMFCAFAQAQLFKAARRENNCTIRPKADEMLRASNGQKIVVK